MHELRRRMTTNPSYSRLTTEDEIDIVPEPLAIAKPNKVIISKKSTFCAKFCFFFSISGIIFLIIIAMLLSADNLYLKVSSKNEKNKPKLAEGVYGAILMYITTMLLSAYSWYTANASNNRVGSEDYSRLVD